MKYTVNDNCIGCGMCTGICGNVFSIGDEGVAVAIEGDIPAADEADAAEAKESCPVSAIEEA
ncbi:MAG: ferredoxin [Clostridiales bacterium]|nr:ferredoxin [Clostridiales bacterium]